MPRLSTLFVTAGLLLASQLCANAPTSPHLLSPPDTLDRPLFVSPNNEWRIASFSFFGNSTKRYTFAEDSILIEGNWYHNLIPSILETGDDWQTTQDFYRQEGDRVYKWDAINRRDNILYYFDVQVGDTIFVESGKFGPGIEVFSLPVTAVDTIDLGDGVARR